MRFLGDIIVEDSMEVEEVEEVDYRSITLLLAIVFLLIVLGTASVLSRPPVSRPTQSGEQGYVDLGDFTEKLNSYRSKKSSLLTKNSAMKRNDLLTKLAQEQADYCATINTLQHEGRGGSLPQHRVRASAYEGVYCTENGFAWPVAMPANSDIVLGAWDKSPGHKAGLLIRESNEYGIAYSVNTDSGWGYLFYLSGRR
jgi:uncharacterized protein YkwD